MKVIIDDAADVPAKMLEEHNIVKIPVNIHFGMEEFLTSNMTREEFYTKAETVTHQNWPKTSQPTPYQFEELFRQYMEQGESDFLVITVGDKLSGTYASAIAAQKALKDEANIHVFNSESASVGQGLMGVEAARMFSNGASLEDVMERLAYIRDHHVIALVIDKLDWAVKGGRVSGLRRTLASILNIKPIMQVKDGMVVEAGKKRTQRKAIKFMADFVKEQVGNTPVKLGVLHANAPDKAERLLQILQPMFNDLEVFTINLCLPVAINLGPGTLGIAAVPHFTD